MLFIAKPPCLFCEGRLRSLGGKTASQGGCFLEGIVSVWVPYLQGAAVPHGLFFALMCGTEVQLTTPLFLSLRFRACALVSNCVSLSQHPVCMCAQCVLAACSCCDRWSAAHAQINRPTLLKSGLCLLSKSLSLSLSLCSQLPQCPHPLSLPLISQLCFFNNWKFWFRENCAELQPSPGGIDWDRQEGDGQLHKKRTGSKE